MPIIKPTLPPRAGYVEAIDADGNHYYKPTAATLEKQSGMDSMQDAIDTMLIDFEYRLILLELGVTEEV